MKVPMRMPVSMVAPLKFRCTTEADSWMPPLLSTSAGIPNTSAAVCTAALVACGFCRECMYMKDEDRAAATYVRITRAPRSGGSWSASRGPRARGPWRGGPTRRGPCSSLI